jgi:hypothetical protein
MKAKRVSSRPTLSSCLIPHPLGIFRCCSAFSLVTFGIWCKSQKLIHISHFRRHYTSTFAHFFFIDNPVHSAHKHSTARTAQFSESGHPIGHGFTSSSSHPPLINGRRCLPEEDLGIRAATRSPIHDDSPHVDVSPIPHRSYLPPLLAASP